MIILVNPVGDFPLNDDWIYGKMVKILTEQHTLDFKLPTQSPALTQVFYGAIFVKLFGFSYTVLRISVLILGWLGILVFYKILIELEIDSVKAFLGALLLCINPFYFHLAHSFMTDVPFTVFALFSLYFFIKGLKQRNQSLFCIGIFFICLTVLIRQLGIILAISAAVGLLFRYPFSFKVLIITLLTIILPIFCYSFYFYLLNLYGIVPEQFTEKNNLLLGVILNPSLPHLVFFFKFALRVPLYLTIFVIPIIILSKPEWISNKIKMVSFISISVTVIFAIYLLVFIQPNFLNIDNYILSLGMGPLTLADTYLWGYKNYPHSSIIWLSILSIIGIATGMTIITWLLNGIIIFIKKNFNSNIFYINILLLIFSILYLIPLCLIGYFDRHLTIIYIPLIILILYNTTFQYSKPLLYTALFIIVLQMYFCIGATHDYLEWNRSRWQAINDLQAQGIDYQQIDCGLECNCFYGYTDISFQTDHPRKSWWWVRDDKYVITFGEVNGFQLHKEYNFNYWLPPATGKICVLKRNDIK